MRFRLTVLVSALAIVISNARAPAQTVCSPDVFGGADPVVLTGDITLEPGCVLDFKARGLVVQGTIRSPDLSLIAGSVTVAPSGKIDASAASPLGSGGFISIQAAGPLVVQGSLLATGGTGSIGGEVSLISTGGAITLRGSIDVSGGTNEGGIVRLAAATQVDVQGPIRSAGRCAAEGCTRAGRVQVVAGTNINVTAPIAAGGADAALYGGDAVGGVLELDAGAGIILGAEVDVSAGPLSAGGSFTARSTGDYTQKGGVIRADGRFADSSGGSIRIAAGGQVDLHGVHQAGGGILGRAGGIEITAELDLVAAGEIHASANFASSGVLLYSNSGSISVASRIDAAGNGDFGTGGEITIDALEGITLAGVQLDVSGSGESGLGGAVRIRTLQRLEGAPGTRILAGGDAIKSDAGEGGLIDLLGCQVLLEAPSTLQAGGQAGGRIFVTSASGSGVKMSSAVTAVAGGLIVIQEPAALLPDVTGSTFSPPFVLVPNGDPAPCFGAPDCDPPSDLTCLLDGSTVSLAWRSGLGQTSTRILRDGAPLSSQDASVETYTDPAVPAGPHTYALEGACGSLKVGGPTCAVTVGGGPVRFIRADYNQDGALDLSDSLALLGCLFLGQRCPRCEDSGDANDDGTLDISDALYGLSFLFLGGRPPREPFPSCGVDESRDSLGCLEFRSCR